MYRHPTCSADILTDPNEAYELVKLRSSGEEERRNGNGRQGVDQYTIVTAHSMTTTAQPVLADEGGYAVPSLSPLTPAAEMAIYEHVS